MSPEMEKKAQGVAETLAYNTYARASIALLTLVVSGLGFPMLLGFAAWLAGSISALDTKSDQLIESMHAVNTIMIQKTTENATKIKELERFQAQRDTDQDRRMEEFRVQLHNYGSRLQ